MHRRSLHSDHRPSHARGNSYYELFYSKMPRSCSGGTKNISHEPSATFCGGNRSRANNSRQDQMQSAAIRVHRSTLVPNCAVPHPRHVSTVPDYPPRLLLPITSSLSQTLSQGKSRTGVTTQTVAKDLLASPICAATRGLTGATRRPSRASTPVAGKGSPVLTI